MNNLTFGNDALSILRDDLLRRAGRPRLRRRRGGPHPHDQFPPDRSRRCWRTASPSCWRISTSAAARAGAANGMPATAPAAPSASARRWTAPSCRAIAACAPFGLEGGEPGRGRPQLRAPRSTGAIEELRAATRPCSRPARRSRSSRRPAADSAFRRAVELHPRTAENVELRGAGTHRRCGLAVARPASARTRRNGSSTAPLLKRQQ